MPRGAPDTEESLYRSADSSCGGSAHQNGTIRFGNDPSTSTGPKLQGSDLDNLYVVDASSFPRAGR
ncbi:MAG: GMC oxidoreductase [Thermodesulfobacteriota bacterium]